MIIIGKMMIIITIIITAVIIEENVYITKTKGFVFFLNRFSPDFLLLSH